MPLTCLFTQSRDRRGPMTASSQSIGR